MADISDSPHGVDELPLSFGIPKRPLPDQKVLRDFYVGKHISQVPKPAAVLDVAKIRRHCSSMLETVKELGVGFRPHVKTHKTTEVTRLQLGNESTDAKFVFSTLAELEYLIPLLLEISKERVPTQGSVGDYKYRQIDALYGIPLPPSQVDRLAGLGQKLPRDAISVMVDHVSQLEAVTQLSSKLGYAPGVFLKIDTGYHRAGVPPTGVHKDRLVERLVQLSDENAVRCLGLYSHSSLSYNGSNPEAALEALEGEINGCDLALKEISRHIAQGTGRDVVMDISVGATPQIAAAYYLCTAQSTKSESVSRLRDTLDRLRGRIEFHAGVYSILDMQQLTTNAKAKAEDFQKEIAITVATEVVSLYNDNEREQPEALLAVGALGLGREPCAHYKGWGVIKTPASLREQNLERRLIVTRISQEHSIVSWEYDSEKETGHKLPPIPLNVGQVVEIFPNHACITGAMYDWYLVVDSDEDEKASKITDVWVRTGGW